MTMAEFNAIYILIIRGDILNEDEDIIITADSKSLIRDIATTKLANCPTFLREYTRYCRQFAQENPLLQPHSYRTWLMNMIEADELCGVQIMSRVIVTAENFASIKF